ncbi:unnamed protein product [Malus baccata var. baccata]
MSSIMMLKLSQSHGMKPREVRAMREHRRVQAEMGNFRSSEFQLMISDVQTWVSAALTDETTCSDGFDGNLMNGNLKTVVRGIIVNIAQLTCNSLALVNRYVSEMASSSFVTSFLLTLSFTCCIFSSPSVARNDAQKTNNEFMKTSCSATTYPKLCLASLSSLAGAIQTSPKLMACAALNVTLASAISTSTMMSKLSHSHGMEPKEVGAMRDCVEELGDSVYELKKSIAEMGSFKSSDFQLMISDVQTWVSAALTDETTCFDGFEENGMNGKLKTIVGGRIVKIAQLTSNALALINRYASVHD